MLCKNRKLVQVAENKRQPQKWGLLNSVRNCKPNQSELKRRKNRGTAFTPPLTDKEFERLEFEPAGGNLNAVTEGKTIIGVEPVNPDGVLIYLMGPDKSISVLEIGYDCLTRTLEVFFAKHVEKERSSETEAKENNG